MDRTAVTIPLDPPSLVHVGAGILGEVHHEVGENQAVVLFSDETVFRLHGDSLGPIGDVPTFTLPPGEEGKEFAVLEDALNFLADAGVGREDLLITLGGGAVSDLGGLAASLFKRGIAVVHCPTTLLAQVDASVGGKTAVNLPAGKNLAGTFHQPQSVFCDVRTLETLQEEQFQSGLGEVVKTSLLAGHEFLEFLEANEEGLRARKPVVLREVVLRCVRHKANLIAEDERDHGVRKTLNLGHTFAHAIEHCSGYGHVPHGVAVAVGLILALAASETLGVLEEKELVGRVSDLLGSLGLPTSLPDLRECYGVLLPTEDLIQSMSQDKKGVGGSPRFVLLQGVGKAVFDQEISPTILNIILA
jgi:3-dehydroquinate synthase